MLVITRRNAESIIIDGRIEIIVTDIGNDKVKLCINAPKEIPILRKELLEVSSMNREASLAPRKQSLEQLKNCTKSLLLPPKKSD